MANILHSSPNLDIYTSTQEIDLERPLLSGISAGFPSPAADFTDATIDLNSHLIKHPSATFFGRVKGDSMKDLGIDDGDLLIIDKSIKPSTGKIAVCFLDGEFIMKSIKIETDGIWLIPANKKYKSLHITEGNDFRIWGIVTHVIKSY